jgi:pilus assembly protein CpaB
MKRFIAVLAAILIGIVGTTAVAIYARASDERALAGQEAVKVFLVKTEVPAGTTAEQAVTDGLMKQELVARKAVPADTLAGITAENGQLVATTALQPGTMVMSSSFAAKATTEGALTIPNGKFAVSVALDDPSHVGSFVQVGSHVAIYDTFEVGSLVSVPEPKEGMKEDESWDVTKLLLPDIEVLAVGTTTVVPQAPKDEEGKAAEARTGDTLLITVAATQAEAEKLIHVSRTGLLTFALLGPDARAVDGRGVNDHRLFTDVSK